MSSPMTTKYVFLLFEQIIFMEAILSYST